MKYSYYLIEKTCTLLSYNSNAIIINVFPIFFLLQSVCLEYIKTTLKLYRVTKHKKNETKSIYLFRQLISQLNRNCGTQSERTPGDTSRPRHRQSDENSEGSPHKPKTRRDPRSVSRKPNTSFPPNARCLYGSGVIL